VVDDRRDAAHVRHIGSLIVDYFDDIHSKNLGKHIESLWFLFNMLQNKLLYANLLHWEIIQHLK
jgi:hypothetical protein